MERSGNQVRTGPPTIRIWPPRNVKYFPHSILTAGPHPNTLNWDGFASRFCKCYKVEVQESILAGTGIVIYEKDGIAVQTRKPG